MPQERSRDSDAIRITTAATSHAADIAARQRRYIYSMSLRSICFIGAVTTAILGGPGWVVGVLITGALVLPYVAVVMANARSSRADDFELREPAPYRPQLSGGADLP